MNTAAENFKAKYFIGSNVAEVTDEMLNDMLAIAEETTIEEDITELHNVIIKAPAYKIDGVLNPAYSAWVKEQVEASKAFIAKYGEARFTTFKMYTTLKTRLANVPNCLNKGRKLQNSRGNGYGNGTF